MTTINQKRIHVRNAIVPAARWALRNGLGLEEFLRCTRNAYAEAKLHPEVRRGPAPAENDAWGPLVEAAGGVVALARELGTNARSLRRWRAGEKPSRSSKLEAIDTAVSRYRVAHPLRVST